MSNFTSDQLLQKCEDLYVEVQQVLKCIEESRDFSELEAVLLLNHDVFQKIEEEAIHYIIPHRVPEIIANLIYYEQQLHTLIQQQSRDKLCYHLRFHYCNLVRLLGYEIAYIVEPEVEHAKYSRWYPDLSTINHQQIIDKGIDAKYEVSVVLLAYNNLEYTSQCLDSIIQNMGDIDYELIVVDNGSADETKAYFDSLPNAKVIHLHRNIHLVKGFNIGMMAAEGKYIATICNDFIFTPNWLSNLLICLKSDEKIGYASPGATYISNYQTINIPFYSIDDFQQRAKEYNVSDPSKWEERVVLLPNVLCCPTALLDAIGYYDTRYYRGEFLDDDISFRIRRAGYKLVYCGDTVTHHYGSVTTASDHATHSLQEGRKTFYKRYKMDAWLDARKNHECQFIDYSQLANVTTILGIDVKCGASIIDIKNKIWAKHGIETELYTCTSDEKYIPDLKSISNQVFSIEVLTELPSTLSQSIDLIYVEQNIDQYEGEIADIFQSLTRLLRPNGQIIFCCRNNLSLEMMKMRYVQSQGSSFNCRYSIKEIVTEANKENLVLSSHKLFFPEPDHLRMQAITAVTYFFSNETENYDRQLVTNLDSHYSLLQMTLMR